MLLSVFLFLRSVFDFVVNTVFSLIIYRNCETKGIPEVKNKLVLESATSLAKKIRQKEVKAETVVKAFIERIEQVNPIINAVVDHRFDEAIKEAKEVDKFLETTAESLETLAKEKPFLGIPFTTKESTSCKGLNNTFGLLSRKEKKGEEDAEVVRLMKEAGAILLGVTNMPELNLWCESRNNLYGQTLNPYNTSRTVGGSSGGEASIITSCGSPIGIGTDIGGSIRMPAFYCGIFGHKPTTDLTPMKGTTRRTGDEKNSMAVAGPMTRYFEDLTPFLKVLAKAKLSNITLGKPVNLKQTNFYYFEESKDIRVSGMSAELSRALRKAVNHCQEVSGNPCVKVKLEGIEYGYRLWRYWMTKEPYQFEDELGNREKRISIFEELPKKITGKSDFTMAAIYKLIDHKLPQEKASWAEPTTQRLEAQISVSILCNDFEGIKYIVVANSATLPFSVNASTLYIFLSFHEPHTYSYLIS